MALRSMTGFGQAETVTPSGTYRVEVRGVNGRFTDIQMRLPRTLSGLEARLKQEVGKVVSRGSVAVSIQCTQREGDTRLVWDRTAVGAYTRVLRDIKKACGIEGDIALADLLQFSDLVKAETVSHGEASLWRHVKPVLRCALDDFGRSRQHEGRFIERDLRRRLRRITTLLGRVERKGPVRLRAHAGALRRRVARLAGDHAVDPQRLATEVALMADRLDISEECTRLKAHLRQFGATMRGEGPAGKRLGFLLQEMNREANTIGAKANDAVIAHLAVGMKEEVESIREQIQNIE